MSDQPTITYEGPAEEQPFQGHYDTFRLVVSDDEHLDLPLGQAVDATASQVKAAKKVHADLTKAAKDDDTVVVHKFAFDKSADDTPASGGAEA